MDIEKIIDVSENINIGDENMIVDVVLNLVESLKINNKENNKILSFCRSQIQLCTQPKQRYRFQPETTIVSSVHLFISPHAYRFLTRKRSHPEETTGCRDRRA